jgi:acetyl-CoA carboxylase biotin carboxyl carrier protein
MSAKGSKNRSVKQAKPARAVRRRAKGGVAGASPPAVDPTIAIVRELAAIVEAHSLSELAYQAGDLNLTLRRGVGAAAPLHAPAPPPTYVAAAAPAGAPPAPAGHAAAAEAEAAEGLHLVTSPFVGTFYRSPNPEAPAYVEVGDRVDKGQILCIVEAMKLMNEIESDAAGEVVAILVQDADPVEYGQPLFRVRPR